MFLRQQLGLARSTTYFLGTRRKKVEGVRARQRGEGTLDPGGVQRHTKRPPTDRPVVSVVPLSPSTP